MTLGWVVGLRPTVHMRVLDGRNVLRGGSFYGILPVFRMLQGEKTENPEGLGRQARPRIELGTSSLPVLRAEPVKFVLPLGPIY